MKGARGEGRRARRQGQGGRGEGQLSLPPYPSPLTPYPLLLSILFSFVLTIPVHAQTLEPIRYTVSFPAPQTHYVEIEASIPTDNRAQVDLMMAVWTPGSYLIREYARHVEAFTATDPARGPLGVEKTRKNRWRVVTNGARTVVVRYRVYAHEMSVRTNWVDGEFALLNGAPTFITLVESPSRRVHEVRLLLPGNWRQSFSGMAPSGTGGHTYVAPDYDTLVDSPILAGTPVVHEFRVSSKPHLLVDFGERGVWNSAQAAEDLAKVAEAAARFWGEVPFDRYYFYNIIGASGNGLEHRNSTVINTPLESTSRRDGYLEWLSLVAHEYFHAWNVKRLRPVELGPFDYENEVYTTGLWFVEGVTDYYADLLLARAGVATRDEYLRALSAQVRALQTTPGRLEQSAEMASYDAWIKYYRQDENSANTSISYYEKGAVIGFLLDAKLRRMTNGATSLDTVMRLLYARFSREKGYRSGELRAAIEAAAGPAHAREMRAWLDRSLATTAELDYTEAVEWLGLHIGPPAQAPPPWLGLSSRTDGKRTVVSEVRRSSPASAASVSVGDEITALDGEPLEAGQLATRIEGLAPGANLRMSLSGRDGTREVAVTLVADPGYGWSLSVSPEATPEQAQHLGEWLRR